MNNDLQEIMDNTALTCIHVLKKQRKYEYVTENKTKNATESFTCSECLDLNSTNPKKAEKYLRVVCKDCFVDNRITREVKRDD